jgi:hypothetical protein
MGSGELTVHAAGSGHQLLRLSVLLKHKLELLLLCQIHQLLAPGLVVAAAQILHKILNTRLLDLQGGRGGQDGRHVRNPRANSSSIIWSSEQGAQLKHVNRISLVGLQSTYSHRG